VGSFGIPGASILSINIGRTMEDVQRDIEDLSKPLRRIAPMLLNMAIGHDTKPQQVDAQEDNDDGLLDDVEVESSS
jgi:hypothetical protein